MICEQKHLQVLSTLPKATSVIMKQCGSKIKISNFDAGTQFFFDESNADKQQPKLVMLMAAHYVRGSASDIDKKA